jgi:hypothetical protein
LIASYPDTITMAGIPLLPPLPAEGLRTTIAEIDTIVADKETSKNPQKRAELDLRRKELEAKKTLHQNLKTVLNRRAD